MNYGDYFNWTCDVCGLFNFDNDEDYFVGHRWDCLEQQTKEETDSENSN